MRINMDHNIVSVIYPSGLVITERALSRKCEETDAIIQNGEVLSFGRYVYPEWIESVRNMHTEYLNTDSFDFVERQTIAQIEQRFKTS